MVEDILENATATHVYCAQGAFRGSDRFARHRHDFPCLDAAGFAEATIANTALARAVGDHKCVFFAENNTHGVAIDYHAPVAVEIQSYRMMASLAKLAADYQHMVDDGLFLDEAEPFEELLDRCRTIQVKANAIRSQK